MTEPPRDDEVREAVRNALRELLPDVVRPSGGDGQPAAADHEPSTNNGAVHNHVRRTPSGEADPVPLVPAPPVAAVLRPSTWGGPAVPGELIGSAQNTDSGEGGDPQPAALSRSQPIVDATRPSRVRDSRPMAAGTIVEIAKIDDDEDLQLFVRSLVTRLESPRDRLAIKAGRLRFRLQRSAAAAVPPPPDSAPAVRVPKGAVTERHVREAHADGTRLVLARAAVLTPLARETARTLGVQIERENQC